MRVVYTIDDDSDSIILLRLSIQSLLKYSKDVEIYVMYSNVDIEKLKSVLCDIEVNYYPFEYKTIDSMFPKLPRACNNRIYYPSLSRWFLTRLPIKDCWYVDTDILFNCDIHELEQYVEEDSLFVAFNRKNYKDSMFSHTSDMNGGLLYINIEKFNKLRLFKTIVRFYAENADKIRFINQTCYDYLFDTYRDCCKTIISDIYNIRMWNINRYNELLEKVKIFHFNGEDKSLYYRVYNDVMIK